MSTLVVVRAGVVDGGATVTTETIDVDGAPVVTTALDIVGDDTGVEPLSPVPGEALVTGVVVDVVEVVVDVVVDDVVVVVVSSSGMLIT